MDKSQESRSFPGMDEHSVMTFVAVDGQWVSAVRKRLPQYVNISASN
jgi:hypothetical protein